MHVFPTFAVGGAQVRFAALANRWQDRWRHVILSLDGRFDCVERLRIPYEILNFEKRPDEGLGRRLMRIRSMLRWVKPDVLVTSNWGSIEWAMANSWFLRIRHVHTEDGFGSDEAGDQKRRRVLTRRVVLRRSDVVLPSHLLHDSAQNVWRLPKRRLHLIPNGLDLARFRPDGLRADLQVPGEGPIVGTVAALRPEKNLARLIKAVGRLKREGLALRLVIVGDGGERRSLEGLSSAEGLSDRVLFAGHLPQPAAVYRALDIFALSSDTEQMPFSVLEAMATGLPVASTDVGDVATMISKPNLPNMAAKDDESLANALRPLVIDEALRRRIGVANRAKAERDYDQEAMFAAYAGLIDGGGADRGTGTAGRSSPGKPVLSTS
jgi:glycosyltransferase involved in cell wall biosynthesis